MRATPPSTPRGSDGVLLHQCAPGHLYQLFLFLLVCYPTQDNVSLLATYVNLPPQSPRGRGPHGRQPGSVVGGGLWGGGVQGSLRWIGLKREWEQEIPPWSGATELGLGSQMGALGHSGNHS